MTDQTTQPPTFFGADIKTQIERAVEAIPKDSDIVTFSAGENMMIRCAFVSDETYEYSGIVPEYFWNGESWDELGFL
jgi:hypothetical protein